MKAHKISLRFVGKAKEIWIAVSDILRKAKEKERAFKNDRPKCAAVGGWTCITTTKKKCPSKL